MKRICTECNLNIENILKFKDVCCTNVFDLCCINFKNANILDKPVSEKC